MAMPRRHREMSIATTSTKRGQQNPEIKNLCIEIEPSYPLIVAITEFFRAQNKPQQSLELCRLGLDFFPGDLGLRLGLAMSYLDLKEKEKAWMEIKTVIQELNQLAPILDALSKHLRQSGQNNVSEWFHHLSESLSKHPEEDHEEKADSPVPSLFPEEEFQPQAVPPILAESPQGAMETKTFFQIADEEISRSSPDKNKTENERPDSNILSTLTGWLSQLKESKA